MPKGEKKTGGQYIRQGPLIDTLKKGQRAQNTKAQSRLESVYDKWGYLNAREFLE